MTIKLRRLARTIAQPKKITACNVSSRSGHVRVVKALRAAARTGESVNLMHDDELDALLLQAKPDPTPLAARAAQDLAASIATPHMPGTRAASTSKKRKRWLFPAIGIGALALTGAGSLTAYQMHVPPFISTRDEDSRTAKVPIEFVTHDGTPVRCGGYLDYHHLSNVQTKQLKDFIAYTNWNGFGQRHYDQLSLKSRANSKVQGADIAADNSLKDLIAMAQKHVPGLNYLAPKPKAASISASMYNCTYPNGAPK